MVKCVKCRREDAPARCVKTLCQKCCVPACAPDVHGQRFSARGKPGKRAKRRWQNLWKRANQYARMASRTPMVRRAVKDGQATYGVIRLAFLRALRARLRGDEVHEPFELALVLAAHPVDLDRVAEEMRAEFGPDITIPADLVQDAAREVPEEPSSKRRAAESAAASSSGPPRVPSSSTSTSTEDEPETSATVGPSEPPMAALVLLPYQPGNKTPLDSEGLPCSHYRRSVPPVIWTHSKEAKRITVPQGQTYDHAMRVVQHFVSERMVLHDLLDPLCEKPFEWYADFELTEPLDPAVHGNGRWFWASCREWIPRHALGREVGDQLLRMRRLCPAVHSCSLYTLVRTFARGLLPGPLPGKSGRTGIFCFKMGTDSRARASSYYSLYSRLTNDLVVAPRLVLAVDESLVGEPGFGAISAGSGQWLVQPGQVYLVGVYFHVLTVEDAHRSQHLSCGYDTWDHEYELSP